MHRSVAVVEEYLRSLAAHDWEALAATLADDVVRKGPYLDDYRGARAYVDFLRSVLPGLDGYRLDAGRVWGDGAGRVCAELSETVTRHGARLRTDEAVVFDVDELDGAHRIVTVQVFLRKSYDPTEITTDI